MPGAMFLTSLQRIFPTRLQRSARFVQFTSSAVTFSVVCRVALHTSAPVLLLQPRAFGANLRSHCGRLLLALLVSIAGFCGGEQIGAMRSQLGPSLDLDAAIADYTFVIDSALTYPGTTNHAVTCARRGEHSH